MAESTHSELIQDQFTRQAGVFNAAGTITNEQALKMIMRPVKQDQRIPFSMSLVAVVLLFARLRRMSGTPPASI